MDAQCKAIAGLCGGFAAFALTAGIVSRGILSMLSGHSADQGSAWQAEVLMSNPVFQAMHFLMVFVVVSIVFLAFAMACAQIHHRHKLQASRQLRPMVRTEANTPRMLNQKWEG